ncbi:unnamed protein product, partial [marine sediment metagenome]
MPLEMLDRPTVDLHPGAISPSMLINSRQGLTWFVSTLTAGVTIG